MTNYEKDTLNGYRSLERAAAYKKFHTSEWSWGRLVTFFEQRSIARELGHYNWSSNQQVLDIPCGTGVLGKVIHRFPFQVVASDISLEMMDLAKEEYSSTQLLKFVQADITATKFARGSFSCVITLGFFHRVPQEIKRAALRELAELSNNLVIITCSVDTPIQRLKHFILGKLRRNHVPALFPVPLGEMSQECEAVGLKVVRAYTVVPLFSSHAILVLEK